MSTAKTLVPEEYHGVVADVGKAFVDYPSLKTLLSAIIAVCAHVLNGLNELFVILVFFMVLDWITGVAAAFINQELASSKGFRGIMKKVLTVVLIILALLIDLILQQFLHITVLANGLLLYTAVTSWLIATEGISIVENLAKAGVTIPEVLKAALAMIRKETSGGHEDEESSGPEDSASENG